MRFALASLLVLVAGCSLRSSYSADDVNLITLGYHDHDVVVIFRVESSSAPLGVRTTKHGEGVAMEFARSGQIDCAVRRYGDSVFTVTVPYDVKTDRMLYLRDGDKFVQLGGAHAP